MVASSDLSWLNFIGIPGMRRNAGTLVGPHSWRQAGGYGVDVWDIYNYVKTTNIDSTGPNAVNLRSVLST